MNLHDAIMRMETISEHALSELCEDMHPPHAYERGYGDARRGAAELARTAEGDRMKFDTSKMEQLRADAERYRWLRAKPPEVPTRGLDVAMWNDHEGTCIRGADLDAAVDDEIVEAE